MRTMGLCRDACRGPAATPIRLEVLLAPIPPSIGRRPHSGRGAHRRGAVSRAQALGIRANPGRFGTESRRWQCPPCFRTVGV
jgi:hypothetical protein